MAKNFSQIYLDHLINNIPHYIFLKDVNAVYQGCNENFAQVSGLKSTDEVIGKTDHDFPWNGTSSQTYIAEDMEIVRTGQPIINPGNKFLTAQGDYRIVAGKKIPLKDEQGKIIGILGIYTDITEKKAQEAAWQEAKAANIAKSEFLATISHELRIPLTGIMGMAQLLSLDCLLPVQQEQVQDILKAGEHLLSLVNDLLDLNKLESGKVELHPVEINLRTTIEEVAQILNVQVGSRGLEFLINYAPDVPLIVIADPRAIRQIVINLVGNALKFTSKGYILIKVNCLRATDEGVILQFSIQDTGIGISKEKINLIFDSNKQEGSRYSGADVGLTLTKNLIELMGGSIHVSSELHKGTTFIFNIPFQLPKNHEPKVSLPHKEKTGISIACAKGIKPKILLVEDDPIVRKVHRLMIERAGCEVDVAATGEEVLEKSENVYDLVLMDVGLPGMTGLEITKILRNEKRRLINTPIIAMTGYGNEEDKENCLAAGMDEVATKPISPENLSALLQKWVKRSTTDS